MKFDKTKMVFRSGGKNRKNRIKVVLRDKPRTRPPKPEKKEKNLIRYLLSRGD